MLLVVVMSVGGQLRAGQAPARLVSFISFGQGEGKNFNTYWTMSLEPEESTDMGKIMGLIGELERPARISTALWDSKDKAMLQLEREFSLTTKDAREFAWLVVKGETKKVEAMAEKLSLSDDELRSIMKLAVAYRRKDTTKYLIGKMSPFYKRFKKWERGIYGACVRIRRFTWFTKGRFLSDVLLVFQGHKPAVLLDTSLADEGWQRKMNVTQDVKTQDVPYHQVQTGYYFRLYFGVSLKVIK